MVAGIEWDNVNIAGAFVIGAVLATIATIRIFRVVFSERRREHRNDDGRVDLLYLLEIVLVSLGIVYLAIKIWR